MNELPNGFYRTSLAEKAGEAACRSALPASEPSCRKSRRALFRTGLAVAPLILTLYNRTVWGQSADNGTVVTPISAARRAGLSEEEIEQLRRQLQEAEGTDSSVWFGSHEFYPPQP